MLALATILGRSAMAFIFIFTGLRQSHPVRCDRWIHGLEGHAVFQAPAGWGHVDRGRPARRNLRPRMLRSPAPMHSGSSVVEVGVEALPCTPDGNFAPICARSAWRP